MEDFVYDHFLAIYGAKKMAEKYLHGFIVGVRTLAAEEATRCIVFGAPPRVPEAAARCTRGCSICTRGCDPSCPRLQAQRLQPLVSEAATPCVPRLQAPRLRRAAPRAGGCRLNGGGGGGALLRTLRGAAARSLQQQCARSGVPRAGGLTLPRT